MIRPAKKEDIPRILELIKELAVFEKEPDAVKTTEKDLLRDGFSDTPYFHILVFEEKSGFIPAFALYFFNWSTWEGQPSLHLEDLYVAESSRGQKIGFQLLKHLAKIALEKNCRRFEWEVLDWNESARTFYHKIGASHKKGWLPYRLEGPALKQLALTD